MKALNVPPAWRQGLLALFVLWAVTLWIYRDTAGAMVSLWNRSETYAHAWVVPPIALWLAWQLRDRVLAITPRPMPWILLAMLAVAGVWLAAELVAVNTATQFALVALLVLAVPALLGLDVAWVLLFPLGFLFFSVPAGEFLTPTLIQWTADVTIAALRLSGIPVYREGLQFVIPTGTWSVVEACSGVRYLIASVMVGTLFAYLNYHSLKKRLIFVGISIVVPVVANWLRAYMIVMLGHYSGNTLAVGADHLVYGWVLFGIVIMTLYWIGARWAEPHPEQPALPPTPGRWSLGTGWAVTVVAAVLALLPMVAWQRIDAQRDHTAIGLHLPDQLVGAWRATDDVAPRWLPGFRNPSHEARLSYRGDDGVVGVYLGYYRHQNDERKLVSSMNLLVQAESRLWNQVATAWRPVPEPAAVGRVLEGQLLQSEAAGPGQRRQRLRVWRCYWVDGQLVSGDAEAKLRGAWGRLWGRGDDSAVILLYADEGDANQAEAALTRFVPVGLPAIRALLESARRPAPGV